MPKKKIQQFDRAKAILYGVVIGLVVILVSVLLAQLDLNQKAARESTEIAVVSLGAMEYDFAGEKAVKRNDETVKGLREFLQDMADKDISDSCPTAHYNVVKASRDEKQVLLEYGCYYPSARMFAVNENGAWRTISPTNQFDLFGIPECTHLNEYAIEKTIAPVCVNWADETRDAITYTVR